MRARLWSWWLALRSSFWFVPALMAAAAVALAAGMLWLDSTVSDAWVSDLRWIHSRSNAGARDLLSTVASSMITIAGLTFSIIVVALQLASSQLGPRLLRNFMRDTGNQLVLGTFIATFLYCLVVMRTIGGSGDEGPLPRLSVTVAVLLAVAGVGVLIYFLHHAAAAMQATSVIAAVSESLHASIERLYPEQVGQGDAPPPADPRPGPAEPRVVTASRSGYLQTIDDEGLMALASDRDVVVELASRPGAYLVAGDTLARAWPADRADDRTCRRIRQSCILGGQRLPEHDVEFTAGQLVDVALRALSPALNDPHTAVSCVHHLTSALVLLFGRDVPSPLRVGENGRVRLIAPGPGPEHLMSAVFDPLRSAGRSSGIVVVALVQALERLARVARMDVQAQSVRQHLRLLVEHARELPDEHFRQVALGTAARAVDVLASRKWPADTPGRDRGRAHA